MQYRPIGYRIAAFSVYSILVSTGSLCRDRVSPVLCGAAHSLQKAAQHTLREETIRSADSTPRTHLVRHPRAALSLRQAALSVPCIVLTQAHTALSRNDFWRAPSNSIIRLRHRRWNEPQRLGSRLPQFEQRITKRASLHQGQCRTSRASSEVSILA